MIVGEAADGGSAVAMAADLKPDIVLLELGARDTGGLAATRAITADPAGTRVLALSVHNAKDYLSQAVRAGASGYVLKDSTSADLVTALRTVAKGGTFHAASTGAPSETVMPDVNLTPRQREVLQLIAQGRTTREIAGTLSVSVKTIETHRAQLMEKTKIRDVAGLVRLAIRMGLAGL